MIQALEVYRVRWNAWTSVSVNRRIFAASLTVGVLSAATHVCTAAKELVVAYQFGTTDVLDAYLIAYLLPSFLISVVAGSFPSAFIPAYIDVQNREGRVAAENLYANVMGWSLLILVGLSLIMALLATVLLPIVGSGFGEEKLTTTRTLYFTLLPLLILKGVGALWTTKLNATHQFAMASAVPFLTPIITMSALLYGFGQWKIYALVAGTVGGALMEILVLGWYLQKTGVRLMPLWSGWNCESSRFLRQYGPVVVGSLVLSGTGLVDQSMAAMLNPGSVSALSYGSKVVSLIVGVGSLALSTVIFPHFSKMVSSENWEEIIHTFRTYAVLSLTVTVPLTLTLIYFSKPLVGLLFERGAFGSTDMQLVGEIQALYLIQVPFYLLSMLVVRLISSLRANHLLLKGACISFVLNLVLNYLSMQWLGVAGIALSTSIVHLLSFVFLYSQLQVQMREVRCG